MNITRHQKVLYLAGSIILLIGLISSVIIYRTASDNSNNVIGYEEINGVVYPLLAEDSRKYMRNLELVSGKSGVLVSEFNQWLVGLWQGKSLAFTILFLSVVISSGIFFVAYRS